MNVHVAPIALAEAAIAELGPALIVTLYCGQEIHLPRPSLHLPVADIITPKGILPCRQATVDDISRVANELESVESRDGTCNILCMCRAGLSRSPAMALAIVEWMSGPTAEAWASMKATNSPIVPNPDILTLAADFAGGSETLDGIRQEVEGFERPTDEVLPQVFSFTF